LRKGAGASGCGVVSRAGAVRVRRLVAAVLVGVPAVCGAAALGLGSGRGESELVAVELE
jgi:hypothetical protein